MTSWRAPGSEVVGGEGVAALDGALLEAAVEPANSLGGGAVGEGVGVDPTRGPLRDAVVPDGLCRVARPRDVVLGELADDGLPVGVPGLLRALRPDAPEAVGHQLHAHGVALRTALGADLAEDAELVLDVVAVLVRDHVADRERPALRPQLALQHVVEEGGVEVDLAVVRAVEGAHLRAGLAA